MNSIEQRLLTLEDKLAVIELEGAYARAYDEHDGNTWSSLFTSDGIYQSRQLGDEPPQTFVQGTEALRQFCIEAPFEGIHLMHLPQITFDGDTATSRIHLEFHGSFPDDPDAPRMHLIGYYDVAYQRVAGNWLISRRVTTAYSRAPDGLFGYPRRSGLA